MSIREFLSSLSDKELEAAAAGGQLCECGCGKIVTPDKKGRYRRFVNGHQMRGECHYNYNGGRWVNSDGYVMVRCPEHPRAIKGYVKEHILVLEKAFRRPILATERIHHIDGNRSNNHVGNLILFKNHSMHNSYEARLRAFKATGHWDWKLCLFCHQYDAPTNMVGRRQDSSMYHQECRRKYNRGELQ